MKERSVEALLVKGVKGMGGVCIKIMPVVAGLPDRLAVLPGGRFFFIETKSPTGTLRPIQRAVFAHLEGLGAPVTVLHTTGEVRAWLAERAVG
jgi:hypothetical protein